MTLQSFDIRKVWDNVKPGLEVVKALTDPDWRLEDMYSAVLSKRAFIFMPDEDAREFVILTQNVSVYSGEAYLIVIAAYSESGCAVAKYQEEIDDIARESGCKSIEFVSPRKGWERHAIQNGYAVKHVTYRREL